MICVTQKRGQHYTIANICCSPCLKQYHLREVDRHLISCTFKPNYALTLYADDVFPDLLRQQRVGHELDEVVDGVDGRMHGFKALTGGGTQSDGLSRK